LKSVASTLKSICRVRCLLCCTVVCREDSEHLLDASNFILSSFPDDYELKLNLREKDKIRKRQRAQALLQLEQSTEELIASRNDYIFTEGDPGDEIYILEEGRIDHSVKGNKVFTVQRRGEIFGVHAFLFGRPRNVTAQCKSETCKLHILRSSDFTKILNSHPAMKESFRDMCHRREFQKAICVMTQKPFPENIKDLRKAFDAVDINHSGTLELPNIRNAIKTLDPVFTEQDIRDILKSLDIDESGTVSWEEFKRLFGMDSGDAH
jgi:CRP-like cAMP-binding protein